MSKRPEITADLSAVAERYIDPHNDPRIYWAREVTFDYAMGYASRVDYMLFKPVNNSVSGIEKGDVYCYEIKSSVEDFRSKNGHNFIGDYNYYIMPKDVYETIKEEILYNIGVLVPSETGLQSVKKARRKNRTKPLSEMLMMMWRSSRRELVNIWKGSAL
ncbi:MULTISPECIES: hypothetical protein [unclassified Emergencia]|jgi:hypothetical protein|uniref:hypothetical protein n=1 Tax=unclassified Emergencia TaxID=2642996 RepID=UPI00137A3E2B|nr:hypothetical protein [Emergencia sp. 1XD21-10]NCE98827.1 hypothetical protein [Emergencia sp. 1XD21-10]